MDKVIYKEDLTIQINFLLYMKFYIGNYNHTSFKSKNSTTATNESS